MNWTVADGLFADDMMLAESEEELKVLTKFSDTSMSESSKCFVRGSMDAYLSNVVVFDSLAVAWHEVARGGENGDVSN